MEEVYKYINEWTLPTIGALLIYYFNGFKGSVDRLERTVGSLNMTMATLVSKDKEKDRRLDEMVEDHRQFRTEISSRVGELHDELEKTRDRVHDLGGEISSKVALNHERIKQINRRLDHEQS